MGPGWERVGGFFAVYEKTKLMGDHTKKKVLYRYLLLVVLLLVLIN